MFSDFVQKTGKFMDEIIGNFYQETVDEKLKVYGLLRADEIVEGGYVEIMHGGVFEVLNARGGRILAHSGAIVDITHNFGVRVCGNRYTLIERGREKKRSASARRAPTGVY